MRFIILVSILGFGSGATLANRWWSAPEKIQTPSEVTTQKQPEINNTKTYTTTAQILRVRSAPYGMQVGSLTKGAEVTGTIRGEWLQIDNKLFVHKDYVKEMK